MADLVVLVGVYVVLLAVGGVLMERHERWFDRLSDELFGDDE